MSAHRGPKSYFESQNNAVVQSRAHGLVPPVVTSSSGRNVFVVSGMEVQIKDELCEDIKFEPCEALLESEDSGTNSYQLQQITEGFDPLSLENGNNVPFESLIDSDEDESFTNVNLEPSTQGNVSQRLRRSRRPPTERMVESLCRLCERMSLRLIKIFESQGKRLKLAEKIHFHLPIRVSQSDKLPLGICASCVEALKTCDELYKTSLSTDDHLRQKFLKRNLSELCSSNLDSINNLKKSSKSQLVAETMRDAGKQKPVKTTKTKKTSDTRQSNKTASHSDKQPAETKVNLKKPATKTNTTKSGRAPPVKRTQVVKKATQDKDVDKTQVANRATKDKNVEKTQGVKKSTKDKAVEKNHVIEKSNKDEDPGDDNQLATPSAKQDFNVNSADADPGAENCEESSEDEKDMDRQEKDDQDPADPSEECDDGRADNRKVPKECDVCEKIFESITELTRHRKSHSSEELLTCKFCGKIYTNEETARTHRKRHKEPLVQCDICSKVVVSLRIHKQSHEPPKFCCQICGKTTRTEAQLQAHIASHSDERPHSCSTCGQTFKLEGTLRQHQHIHSALPLFICDICGHGVNRKSHLRLHKLVHTKGDNRHSDLKHTCAICHNTFKSVKILLKHAENAHRVKSTDVGLCELCGQDFITKEGVTQHRKDVHQIDENFIRSASGAPYECEFCGRQLKSLRSLIYHTRGHTGERPFECSICKRSFKIADARDRHERTHSGERPFKCNVCSKAFYGYTTLCQHKASHKEKNHKCSYCEYKTHRAAALRIHLRTHTGEKPFSCSICGKSYKQYWDLKLHNAVHTGEPVRRRVRPKQNRSNNDKVELAMIPESGESNEDSSHQQDNYLSMPLI